MSVELEQARSEILSLKRELSALKLENRKLLAAPSEESVLRSRIRSLESDLKEALSRPTQSELAGVKSELRASMARINELEELPTEEDINSLKAELSEAYKQIESLNQRASAEDFTAVKTELREVLRENKALKQRPTDDELESAKEDLSAALQRIKDLELRPTKDDFAKERKAKLDAEANMEAIWSDLKEAKQDIARFQSERKAKEEKADAARESFIAGPNVKEQQLRQRLKEAEAELWRLKDVRDK